MREEITTLETELTEKQRAAAERGGSGAAGAGSGDGAMRFEEFKRYVQSVKSKHQAFKARKSELGALQTEVGTLSRTREILQRKADALQKEVEVCVCFFCLLFLVSLPCYSVLNCSSSRCSSRSVAHLCSSRWRQVAAWSDTTRRPPNWRRCPRRRALSTRRKPPLSKRWATLCTNSRSAWTRRRRSSHLSYKSSSPSGSVFSYVTFRLNFELT